MKAIARYHPFLGLVVTCPECQMKHCYTNCIPKETESCVRCGEDLEIDIPAVVQ